VNCKQLTISKRLGFGHAAGISSAETLSIEIGKMLWGLSAYLAREIQTQSSKRQRT
jgi:hypothetical protein